MLNKKKKRQEQEFAYIRHECVQFCNVAFKSPDLYVCETKPFCTHTFTEWSSVMNRENSKDVAITAWQCDFRSVAQGAHNILFDIVCSILFSCTINITDKHNKQSYYWCWPQAFNDVNVSAGDAQSPWSLNYSSLHHLVYCLWNLSENWRKVEFY